MKKNLQQLLDVQLEDLSTGLLAKLGRKDINCSNVVIAKNAGQITFSMDFEDNAREVCEMPKDRTPLERRLRLTAEKNGFASRAYLIDAGSGKDYIDWRGLHLAGSLGENHEILMAKIADELSAIASDPDGTEEEQTEEEKKQTLKDELANVLDERALGVLSEIDGFDITYGDVVASKSSSDGVSIHIYFDTPVRELCSWSPFKQSFLERQVSALARKNGFDFGFLFNSDEEPGLHQDHVDWTGLTLGTAMH